MPALPHNVERNPLHAGQYTAFDATGFAFRVYKTGKSWRARPSHLRWAIDHRMFTADTLAEIGKDIGRSYWTPPAAPSNA